jgi:hypothetical protein
MIGWETFDMTPASGLILGQEMGAKISLHGLGFVQVQLQSEDLRLHVWHPDLPRRKCFQHSQIHDHRFGFESQILVGSMANHRYTVSNLSMLDREIFPHEVCHRDFPNKGYVAYRHDGTRNSETGNRPWDFNGFVYAEPRDPEVIRAGERYFMAPYEFHRTEPLGDGRVVTLMRKTTKRQEKGATSLCRPLIQPDVDFDRYQLPDEELWQFVFDALRGGTGA